MAAGSLAAKLWSALRSAQYDGLFFRIKNSAAPHECGAALEVAFARFAERRLKGYFFFFAAAEAFGFGTVLMVCRMRPAIL